MEALFIAEKTNEIAYIFRKLINTVEANSDIYPELMYVTSGLELVKKQHSTEESLDVLEGLSKYLKDKLSEYYVVRNLNHKFLQDLDLLKAGSELNQEEEFYLTF